MKYYRQDDYHARAGENLNSETDLNVGEWLGAEPFSVFHCVVCQVHGSYGISSLSRPISWPYHRLNMKRFHRDGSVKLGAQKARDRRRSERGK